MEMQQVGVTRWHATVACEGVGGVLVGRGTKKGRKYRMEGLKGGATMKIRSPEAASSNERKRRHRERKREKQDG